MSQLQKFLLSAAATVVLAMMAAHAAQAADIVRHSDAGNFPIARAVEVPAGKTIYFHSGMTPAPLDPKATPGTPEYWGDTKTQTASDLMTDAPAQVSEAQLKELHIRVRTPAVQPS